jgi:PPOX class probable FMN-dependent enzyme
MSRPTTAHRIEDEAALRAIQGEPSDGARAKAIDRIDDHARRFLERCPFVVLATRGKGGGDCSPRGDAPGFLRVLDDTTLLLPERPGNRRADSLVNVLEDPRVGLLCMIPGMNETLRLNGRAWIVEDPELLAASAVGGKAPRLGLWIHVEELYFHCAKAFVRSRLWDASRQLDRSEFPSLGRMVLDQIHGRAHDPDEALVRTVDAALAQDERENLY